MIDHELLRHAFQLLCVAELGPGRPADWAGPDDVGHLQTRVELLAVQLNILPRSRLDRLAEVISDWKSQFPDKAIITAGTLRQSAHRILRDVAAEDSSTSATADMRLIEAFLKVRPGTRLRVESPLISAAGRQQCGLSLSIWQTQLRKSIEWNSLPGVVPGDPRIPIESVYVDLYACPQDERVRAEKLQDSVLSRASRGGPSTSTVSIGLAAMVARTLEFCVVIGEPGSGKSTLIQWLAWATNDKRLHDFDFALVIKLRQYADVLRKRPAITLIEFFMECVIPQIGDSKEAAECLRQAATESRRVLLLLDGWDEVPAAERDQIRRQIERECPHFVVVLTSRASGLPWQYFSGEQTNYYEIAGLSPPAIRSFVKRQMGAANQADVAEKVIETIEREGDLRVMATNPFVLGMLIRVLSHSVATHSNRTLAELFHEIISWVVEHQRQARSTTGHIVGGHLRALQKLSYALLFAERSPRYVFHRQELDEALGELNPDPLLDSRFIDRLDSVFDSWGFLHATFEEYFAASHMEALAGDDLKKEWDRALCSQSRFVVLEFVVGLTANQLADSTERAEHWLKNQDRFGLVLLRLSRLAVAGQWTRRLPELTRTICELIWGQITSGSDWRSTRLFVEAFAALNPLELVQRASSEPQVDVRVWEAITALLSLETIKEGGLHDKLPKNMREHLALRARARPPQEQIDRVLLRLSNDSLPPGELLQLMDEAALMSDSAIALQLLRRLQGAADEDLSTTLVLGLSPLFGLLPRAAVLDVLTESHQLPTTIRRMAGATMSHGEDCGQMLEPDSRDHLLRRLAVLPPNDDRVGPILDALAGFPIRDGGMLIAQIAVDRALPHPVRMSAVAVLGNVADLEAVRSAVATIPTERAGNELEFLVELAAKRKVAVPLEWLQAKIDEANDPFNRRALLTSYIRMLIGHARAGRLPVRTYLVRHIQAALRGEVAEYDEQSWMFANAIRSVDSRGGDFCDPETRLLVQEVLRQFVAGSNDVSIGQVRLAATLLGGASDEDSIWRLRRSLDTALRHLRKTSDKRRSRELEATALQIAEVLASAAVGQLLEYPSDCDPVRETLADLARGSGWIVFADRILDADGNEVANSKLPTVANDTPGAEVIFQLLEGLSERPRKAITSFWLVTCAFHLCDRDAGYKEIRSKIVDVSKGGGGNAHATEMLREVYPKEIPSLKTWRQNIHRGVKQLQLRANGSAFVNDLGLPRR